MLKQYPFTSAGLIRLGGAPRGCDALALAELARLGPADLPLLHVAIDAARMAGIAAELRFFHPEADVIELPAWDCLPYDRVSPHHDVLARRIDALTRLQDPPSNRPRIVITTVSAALQRMPPREVLREGSFRARVGERLALDDLTGFLALHGYIRAATVREAGEFAVRGGIVDIFPPGREEPARLDLFGDELEAIRGFDALSQLSTAKLDDLRLLPVSEVPLDEVAVERFRSGYRQAFGAVRGDDPLYEAISEGRRHAGMEHWLPLFYERLETVFDYVPDGPVTLDHQADDAVRARLELVDEYFEARESLLKGKGRTLDGAVYRPLPPERLYLGEAEWESVLANRPSGLFSPFVPPSEATGVVDLGGRSITDFAEARTQPGADLIDAVRARLAHERRNDRRTILAATSAGSRARLASLLAEHGLGDAAEADTWHAVQALPPGAPALVTLDLEHGFRTDALVVYTEQDIFGDRLTRPAKRSRKADNFIAEVSSLSLGDLVVHIEHGVGRYDGLQTLEVSGAPHDCARLIYAGDDKLFVPVENLEVLSRYGSEETGAELDRLGRADWQARKSRVKERIREMADKLIKVAAARELNKAPVLGAAPGLYEEFAARFPYEETEDQTRAIGDTLGDLTTQRPMDRLVCGDVGFGKTEVAIRAAFNAVMAGVQVAVVVPTTLLARQHYRTFLERFAGTPVRIAQLSRLVVAREAAETKAAVADGQVDIVIGTHALLAKSIAFRELGLLVVDEEQHFGVAQKERLKALRADVHVLTLTATPIPRTLQLALAGVRDLSLIATPPVDRLAVRTFVLPYDPVIVREAIMREHFRGGQSFYVCPRVKDIEPLRERLSVLVPEIKVAVAHGQLPARQLEAVMAAFYDGKYDLLLSTNIIESGLDIPTANTLIVHRSDMFGLGQLYQLRGRVGRSKTRAYAYLTVPTDKALTESAARRLDVLQTLDSLGAGFSLASHDLDIRGAGNLLGEEQSGHIQEVGIELYQRMLEEAVAAAREGGLGVEAIPEAWTPTISVGTPVLIPEEYVSDLTVRLGLYRRLAQVVDQTEIDGFAAELIDRFGPLPAEVENLLQIIGLKRLCRDALVEKLDAGPKGAVIAFRDNSFPNPGGLVGFINLQAGTVKLRPDHKLVYRRDWVDGPRRLQGLRHLMKQLAELARGEAADAAQ